MSDETATTPPAGGLRAGAGEERIAGEVRQHEGSAALMPYIMGGYPDLATSREIARAYVAGGADLVELGVPYSDPLADGPVIHAAGTAALDAGVTVDDVLTLGEELAKDVPVVLMTYANIVLRPGIEVVAGRLYLDAVRSGGGFEDLHSLRNDLLADPVARDQRHAEHVGHRVLPPLSCRSRERWRAGFAWSFGCGWGFFWSSMPSTVSRLVSPCGGFVSNSGMGDVRCGHPRC
jgi:hypothetical protein